MAISRGVLRLFMTIAVFMLLAVACGSDDLPSTAATAAGTCMAGDPACADFDDTAPLSADDLPPSDNDPGTQLVQVSGVFYADERGAFVCGGLAESFPPQCFDVLATFEGDFEAILAYVGEISGDGDPATSQINHEGDVWWTDDVITVWVLPGEDIVRV